jgi:2-methylcitrate dehydratase PrpD
MGNKCCKFINYIDEDEEYRYPKKIINHKVSNTLQKKSTFELKTIYEEELEEKKSIENCIIEVESETKMDEAESETKIGHVEKDINTVDFNDRYEQADRPNSYEQADRPNSYEQADRPNSYEQADRPNSYDVVSVSNDTIYYTSDNSTEIV